MTWRGSRSAALCSLLTLLALAPSCGGAASNAPPVPLDQLPASLADAVCDNIGACCQAAAILFDLDTCKQNLISNETLGVSERMGWHVKYDAQAAGNCLAAYVSSVQSCTRFDELVAPACDNVFVGQLAIGARCWNPEECAQPTHGKAYCYGFSDDAQGTCMLATPGPVLRGKAGDICLDTCHPGESCSAPDFAGGASTTFCYTEDGLFCSGSTCVDVVALGASCDNTDNCAAGAFCDSGECTLAKPDGASCHANLDCAGGICTFELGNEFTGTCGERILANANTCAGNL